MSTLDDDSFEALVGEYQHEIPILPRDVRPITGGYAGLTEVLLNRAVEHFRGVVSGARAIDHDLPRELMEESARSVEMRNASMRLLRSLERFVEGPAITRQIVEAFHKSRRRRRDRGAILQTDDVSIRADQLRSPEMSSQAFRRCWLTTVL